MIAYASIFFNTYANIFSDYFNFSAQFCHLTPHGTAAKKNPPAIRYTPPFSHAEAPDTIED